MQYPFISRRFSAQYISFVHIYQTFHSIFLFVVYFTSFNK